MIAHNWLASRWRTIPGLPCPARPSMPCQAIYALPGPPSPPPQPPARLHQDRQCRRWRHHHHAAQQLPCASLHQHQHSLVHFTTTKPTTSPPNSSTCRPERGRGAPPAEPPEREGETFCKHANLAPCHPASNGGATLLPSARSWQCISNANSCQLLPTLANSCQLLPTLGNLWWGARKGERQKP